jgi:hypothetical protein
MEVVDVVRRVKKHRRGKKQKPYQKMFSDLPADRSHECYCGDKNNMEAEDDWSLVNQMNENVQQTMAKGKRLIRPPYSPRAPRNSTQFLIADGMGQYSYIDWLIEQQEAYVYSPLYKDQDEVTMFDTPSKVSQAQSPHSPSYPKLDLDNCDSTEEMDMVSFMEKDFENQFSDYSSCHFQPKELALAKKSKDELLADVVSMEKKLIEAEEQIENTKIEQELKHRAETMQLRSLMRELEELKSQNRRLTQENVELRTTRLVRH